MSVICSMCQYQYIPINSHRISIHHHLIKCIHITSVYCVPIYITVKSHMSQFQNSQVFYTTKIIKMNLFFIDLGLLILLSNTCKHVSRYLIPLIIYFHWVIYVIMIQVLNPHKNPKRHDIHKVCVTWWYRDDVRHTPGTVIYRNFWYFLREMFTAISRWNN